MGRTPANWSCTSFASIGKARYNESRKKRITMSDVIDGQAAAVLDGNVSKPGEIRKLQEDMSALLNELSQVQDMSPSQRQRLQVTFELKSLEVKRRIILAEHDDLAAQLPHCREEIEASDVAVKAAQERYRDALNRYSQIDERRKRLTQDAEQILRECEAVRLRMP
jgi:chromosome segregation ATPase